MADIDFATDLTNGFYVSITESPKLVSGNRALLNRFEITFMTTKRPYTFDGQTSVIDEYGGDAQRFISVPQVLVDTKSIAASISVAIDETVKSLKLSERVDTPNTERISSAELISIYFVGDMVTAKIQVIPVETEFYEALEFNLPITRGG